MSDHQKHHVDVHVGGRIRARRRALRQSQGDLAETLGLTFQQVQKYERGVNRVSASKLFEIAQAQGAPVSYYFEGLEDSSATFETPAISTMGTLPGGAELAEIYNAVPPHCRRSLLEVGRALRSLTNPAGQVDIGAIADVEHEPAQPFN